MKKMERNKIVYRVVHIETGKSYIGVTTRGLCERKAEHLKDMERNSPYPFHQAIATYGPDAFKFEQIDTANSTDELAKKEKQYISKYDSMENGYNLDCGGGFKKTVYQYNKKDGSLVNSFDSLDDAANSINSTKQHISRACLNVNNTYGGYFWSYDYKEPFEPKKDERKKMVYQFDKDDNWVASYNSVAEASRKTGFSKSCIARVCRGEREQTHGHIFRYG